MITSNNSPNYQVIAESIKGILFKNKRDRKLLNVDPHVSWIITIGVFVLFYWNLFFSWFKAKKNGSTKWIKYFLLPELIEKNI